MSLFKFISVDCGGGKTYGLTKLIQRTNDHYIIVQATKQLIEQTAKELDGICKVITSDYSGNVEKDVSDFLLNPTNRVLILSEKAFMHISDLSLLRQWKIYLDDVVNFHTYRVINTEKKYEIEHELFKDFAEVTENYVTAKPVTAFTDDLVQSMSCNFNFISSYDHFIMNSNFFDKNGKIGHMDVYSTECKQLSIFAWVDLEKYKGLDLTFMANRFDETLIYKGNPELFKEVKLEGIRQRKVPVLDRLKVYYFSKNNRFTRTYRDANPDALKQVVEYINTNVKEQFYYTTNNSIGKVLNGEHIKPNSRGMNKYQEYTTAVWLASQKPSPVESRLCEMMFNITREEILQNREFENIYQFANRSNLRDYESIKEVVIYVFDEEQARSLTDNIYYIDVGLDDGTYKFEPIGLSKNDYKRYGGITLERYPNIEIFEKYMNKKSNAKLNERQRQHFYNKWHSLSK
ncbi:hypothetical protein [Scandinavium lactucae]|uniref:Type III restriction endonuclease subunit R n=1 Tax=Scandinavium lactucae TaxID=3095028 RepID=A0ABU4QU54_9ENTR|nr:MULTISPECIES: hypothetical protein [unclassified Scandinavium]MDX6042816.1 hypothetical protein [Scandinavium sp. V105_6]MDX6052817.1 hypothetical protein [Scandinavium sp. V105_1]